MDVPAGMEILKEGQYVRMIPIVAGIGESLYHSRRKELLLYYIGSTQSCIMSFSAGLSQSPSRIYAISEEPSLLLLLPSDKINKWIREFPALNDLFFPAQSPLHRNAGYHQLPALWPDGPAPLPGPAGKAG
ncbi:MAG: hypothetical protein IPP99_04990 [Chitinophagaceae bacterium]|nr:hypothetical protein [Chitinophagaceae bacterium]